MEDCLHYKYCTSDDLPNSGSDDLSDLGDEQVDEGDVGAKPRMVSMLKFANGAILLSIQRL